jgi:hypothetical protein
MSVNTHVLNNLAQGYGSAEEATNFSKFNNMLTGRPPMPSESQTSNNLIQNKF